MTLRTLFSIILKLFGLYFLRDIFISIPELLSVILFFKTGQTTEALWTMLSSSMILALELSVSYWCIFRSNWIINKLKLTDGFDTTTIPLNIHRSTVVQIAIIIIGGLLLTDEIPNFCRRLFTYFQQRMLRYNGYNAETPYIVISVVKIILAALILAEHRRIVSLILRDTNPINDGLPAESKASDEE
ncbi:MAG TPA: hypothetical protein VG890_15985 [Puia sp.]|nr:hypothetical protein [Puia sp.]